MRSFLARRLAALVPVLIGVSIVIFLLMHLAPGDVTTTLLGPQATEADRIALRITLGLDQPVPVQYARWVARVAEGDFGTSIATTRPVASVSRMPSAESRTCSAPSATAVITTPRIMTSIFNNVGELLYRESMVAENSSPGGAGPDRSVNTPTICGRKS